MSLTSISQILKNSFSLNHENPNAMLLFFKCLCFFSFELSRTFLQKNKELSRTSFLYYVSPKILDDFFFF